jgi:predicted dehydrogenase
VGHIERFNPAFQELSKVLKTEELLALEAHRMSPYSQRANDVSVVLDLMIHDIDLLLELAAAPVVKLTASGSRASDSGYLDYVTETLGFANGIVATAKFAGLLPIAKIPSLRQIFSIMKF